LATRGASAVALSILATVAFEVMEAILLGVVLVRGMPSVIVILPILWQWAALAIFDNRVLARKIRHRGPWAAIGGGLPFLALVIYMIARSQPISAGAIVASSLVVRALLIQPQRQAVFRGLRGARQLSGSGSGTGSED
jgi:hypothetical protein